jgi:hypothetical protein
MKMEARLKQGEALPFSNVIYCNIGERGKRSGVSSSVWPASQPREVFTGNPQSLKQQPLTFVRQVLSLVLNPSLMGTLEGQVRFRFRRLASGVSWLGSTGRCGVLCSTRRT